MAQLLNLALLLNLLRSRSTLPLYLLATLVLRKGAAQRTTDS